jgi:hypothetical protein
MQSGCEKLSTAEANGDLLRISNTANVVVEVDYEHVYYMNTKTPWIGNASVDTKLNPDGTLSEGNVQVTDQTWSAILTAVSSLGGNVATLGSAWIAKAVTGKAAGVTTSYSLLFEAVCEAPTPPGWPIPAEKLVYKLSTSTEIYVHDHVLEDTGIGASCVPTRDGVTEGNVTITKTDASPAKDDSSAKDEGSTIKITGQATLPKSKDSDKKQ